MEKIDINSLPEFNVMDHIKTKEDLDEYVRQEIEEFGKVWDTKDETES